MLFYYMAAQTFGQLILSPIKSTTCDFNHNSQLIFLRADRLPRVLQRTAGRFSFNANCFACGVIQEGSPPPLPPKGLRLIPCCGRPDRGRPATPQCQRRDSPAQANAASHRAGESGADRGANTRTTHPSRSQRSPAAPDRHRSVGTMRDSRAWAARRRGARRSVPPTGTAARTSDASRPANAL